eukprot:TRINITY_DN8916_c0_g1_i1.p1 TRINITY_DN8916_c0_g1~~TRINITY_DN8916_c0_g1_i1.p1  ORF type:complete len:562 (+),score=124.84 TRINITY_DN8916_c0_g1_i1:144-1829(+)
MRLFGPNSVYCFLVIVALFSTSSEAVVFKFSREKVDGFTLMRIGMWSPEEAPAKTPPGNGRSYVEAKLGVETTQEDAVPFLLVFHSKHQDDILRDGKPCHNGHLIALEEGRVLDPNVVGVYTGEMLKEKIRFNVHKSGVHYAMVGGCNGVVRISGEVTFMNPYGHIPGGYYELLPFYGMATTVFGGMFVIWAVLLWRYRHILLRIQGYITLVFGITLVECAIYVFHYNHFNETAKMNNGLLEFGIFLTILRKTLSRVLLLTVCMGLGIVRPKLRRKSKIRLYIFGVCYFSAAILHEWVSSLFMSGNTDGVTMVLSSIPVIVMDTICYVSVLVAITNTMQYLKSHGQNEKHKMYRTLSHALAFYIISSVGWVIYQMISITSSSADERWESAWTLDAFWFFLFAVVFFVVLIVWRPMSRNTRYAYTSLDMSHVEDGNDLEDDDEESGIVPIMRASPNLWGDDDDGMDEFGTGAGDPFWPGRERHSRGDRYSPLDLDASLLSDGVITPSKREKQSIARMEETFRVESEQKEKMHRERMTQFSIEGDEDDDVHGYGHEKDKGVSE